MNSRYQETTGRGAGERLAWESICPGLCLQESRTRCRPALHPPHLN